MRLGRSHQLAKRNGPLRVKLVVYLNEYDPGLNVVRAGRLLIIQSTFYNHISCGIE